jgi:hypothetical protein
MFQIFQKNSSLSKNKNLQNFKNLQKGVAIHFRDCKSGSIGMKFFDFGVEIFFGYIKVAMALQFDE